MSEKTPRRRRTRGRAWHWRQTDSWYYTRPGTAQRVRLLDEGDRPIRGKENRAKADLALARVKASGNWRPEPEHSGDEQWLVASVCSEYIQHCRQRVANGNFSSEFCKEVVRYLNAFSAFCGALPVAELQRGQADQASGEVGDKPGAAEHC